MKLAIFDIDGTLTDSHGYDEHFFATLAAAAGGERPDRPLSGWTHVTDEAIAYEVLHERGLEPTAADIEGIKAAYAAALSRHMREVPPMPGAVDMLSFLATRDDWQLAIDTGNWTIAGRLKLTAGGIDPGDIPVVGCDGRPSRTELMEHALAESTAAHGTFEHVVYVGDAAWDVNATLALGWNFLGLNADVASLQDLGATHVLTITTSMRFTPRCWLRACRPESGGISKREVSRGCAFGSSPPGGSRAVKLTHNPLSRVPFTGAAAPELSPGLRRLLHIRRAYRTQNLRWALAVGGAIVAFLLTRALGA